MRVLGQTPDGYVVHRVGDTYLVFDRGASEDLVRLRLADPGTRRRLFERAPRRGRGSAPSVRVRSGLDMVLRRYRHGGMLARLLGPLYLGPRRALDELRVCTEAERAGAPVPHVLCLVLWPQWGPLWSALIGTREEPQTRDLLERFQGAESGASLGLPELVGEAVHKLHAAGVDHPDLQLRNILVSDEDPGGRVIVVDLDRARYYPRGGIPVRRRAANLGRLARSAIKCGLWGGGLGQRELAAFVGGYSGRNRELRRELRGWMAFERFKIALHRLRYRFVRDAAAGVPLSGAASVPAFVPAAGALRSPTVPAVRDLFDPDATSSGRARNSSGSPCCLPPESHRRDRDPSSRPAIRRRARPRTRRRGSSRRSPGPRCPGS